ncbi:PGI1A [Auxenochlorella protothecoides x Auxenochlorella symbiontica]
MATVVKDAAEAVRSRLNAVLAGVGEAPSTLISSSPEWKALEAHAVAVQKLHLKDLLSDDARTTALTREAEGLYLDLARQNATPETLQLLLALAEKAGVKTKIDAMFAGQHINTTEDRAVLHVALRAKRNQVITDAGKNVVPEVWEVLDKIKAFSERVRSGEWKGVTGKPIDTVVSIGIGGSALGPLFVHTALATAPEAAAQAGGRKLVFLANVDPVDAVRSLGGLNPETTLAIVVSKTFTTAETMLNARTARAWLTAALGQEAVAKHMVAVSTNLPAVGAFGIDAANTFGFWDWVGGRYSVSSAVGVLPLSLQYGFGVVRSFLDGMQTMDEHYRTAPPSSNLPLLQGLFNVWNATFLGHPTTAILPYQQSLAHFAPHVQQLSMESNGKGVSLDGTTLNFGAGEIDFGEPGTNGQHSFYQLIHQGRVIPAEFIAIATSQQDVYLEGEKVSSHEELMCNFFAQPDALALGKDAATLAGEGVPQALIPHKTFTGNRPSLSLLLPDLTPCTLGKLLALYEHRVATSGFVWGINSFDQWGVELGKALANKVRASLAAARSNGNALRADEGFNSSTAALLGRFLKQYQPKGPLDGAPALPSALQSA